MAPRGCSPSPPASPLSAFDTPYSSMVPSTTPAHTHGQILVGRGAVRASRLGAVAAPAAAILVRVASPRPTSSFGPSHSQPAAHVATSGDTPWSIIVPTWIGALATAGLLLGAIFTVRYARRAFEKQSSQLADQQAINEKLRAVADLQVKDLQESLDERQRDRKERRRAQAANVYVVITGILGAGSQTHATADVTNASTWPIYDIAAQWHTSQQSFGSEKTKSQLAPEETARFSEEWAAADGISGLGVAIDFRDAAGAHWRTTDRGQLTELCGASEAPPYGVRCTFAPDHGARHSWG